MKTYQKILSIIIILFYQAALYKLNAQTSIEIYTLETTNSFLVFINGKQINATPLTNVQVDNLTGRKLTLKIVFNDKDIPTIIEEVKTRIGDYWGPKNEIVKTSQLQYEVKNRKGKFVLDKKNPVYTYEDTPPSITYNNSTPSSDPNQPIMMNETNFQQTYKLIKDAFPDKLQVAKNSLKGSWFGSQQILAIVKLLSFPDDKLDFAKSAYHHTTDKNTYEMVVNEMGLFGQEELRNYISKH